MDKNDGRVVSNFITQALQGKDITIYGDGSQSRSFCYVDDLVRGIVSMMDTPEHVVGPMNLGNPVEFTMLELAELVLKHTGSSSKISYQSLPQDDPRQRKPDITYATQQLNWEPEVFLNEGLQKTIAYFKEII